MTNKTISVTIPIEYIEWISFGRTGAEIFFDVNTCSWDVASIKVPLEIALDAARKIAENWTVDE